MASGEGAIEGVAIPIGWRDRPGYRRALRVFELLRRKPLSGWGGRDRAGGLRSPGGAIHRALRPGRIHSVPKPNALPSRLPRYRWRLPGR